MENIREISLDNCKELGKGQCSIVYKTNEGHAVKLYYSTVDEESIEKEIAKTIEGDRLQIDAARCFGRVSYNGKTGMEMEMIDGTTLQEALKANPDRIDEYARKAAEQLKKIHKATPDPKLFMSVVDFYLCCIDGCKKDGFISEEEALKLKEFVNRIPTAATMVHGDYHILNIMQEKDKIRLIDLADCMTGHPVYDLLVFNLYMNIMPHQMPGLCDKLVGVSSDKLLQFNEVFIRTYFELSDDENEAYERIEKLLNVYSLLKLMLAPYSFSNMNPEEGGKFTELGRKQLMPVIDEYMGKIPENIMDLTK